MSYAIFKTGGKQYRAEPGTTLRIATIVGDREIPFSTVHSAVRATRRRSARLAPGAKVTSEIVKHGKGDKIIVFKFKRRKNYARKQGHRQKFTEVRIKSISLG
jgi:large subunit ribosomal protein L21